MDLRKHKSQTISRSVFWFTAILIFIGLGLVWYFYGFSAAALGFFCILGVSIPVLLIVFAFFGLDFFLKTTDK